MGITHLSNGRWRVQVRRVGQPIFDKVYESKPDAEKALSERTKNAPARGKHTITEVWKAYEASYDFQAKSENTRITERHRIQPVLAALGACTLEYLEESSDRIYEFIDQRTKTVSEKTGRKLSSTSVRLEIAALSAVVAFAKKRRMIQANFVRHIDRPATQKRKRRVPSVEQGRLHSEALDGTLRTVVPARFALILRLLGCRPGELARLLKADVDIDRQEILFRNTKSGNDRRIHVIGQAIDLLIAQWRDSPVESPYLFSTLSRKGVWTHYNYSCGIKLLRESGIVGQDFHAHAMRREFVSRAIEDGMEYATIRKQTGHKSTQAIEIYDEGLSTAPDIRAALDRHAAKVKREQLVGAIESLGVDGEDLEKVRAIVERRKPKRGPNLSIEDRELFARHAKRA